MDVQRWRCRRAWIGGVLLASVLAGVVTAAILSRPYHFKVVEEGVLYRSGLLDPEDLEELIEVHGIRTVVNLQPESINTLPWHEAEAAACSRKGARLIDLPMPADKPATPAHVAAFLEIMDDPSNHPVLVHCQHGVIRTGMMVAVFLVGRRGMTGKKVYSELPRFGHDFNRPWRRPIREFIEGLDASALPASSAPVNSSTSVSPATTNELVGR